MTKIAEKLGPEHAATLARLAGGTRINLTNHMLDRGPKHLIERFGETIAALLIFHFGGTVLYIPTNARGFPVDGERVIALKRAGWSESAIARELRCSDRVIYRKLAKARAAGATVRKRRKHARQ